MSQIIINGQPLYQVDLPEMTMAEYLALPEEERPNVWIREDAEYADIPSENIKHTSVSVTADGAKTYSQLFDALYALLDTTKLTPFSVLQINKDVYQTITTDTTTLMFTACIFNTSTGRGCSAMAKVASSSSTLHMQTSEGNVDNYSSSVPANGRVITLYY